MLLLSLTLKCFLLQNCDQSKTKSLLGCEELGLANEGHSQKRFWDQHEDVNSVNAIAVIEIFSDTFLSFTTQG